LLVSTEADPSRMTVALSRSHHFPQVGLICDRLGIKETIRSGNIGLKVGLNCEGRAHLPAPGPASGIPVPLKPSCARRAER
jgi:hypothetical protein